MPLLLLLLFTWLPLASVVNVALIKWTDCGKSLWAEEGDVVASLCTRIGLLTSDTDSLGLRDSCRTRGLGWSVCCAGQSMRHQASFAAGQPDRFVHSWCSLGLGKVRANRLLFSAVVTLVVNEKNGRLAYS